jgi:hypothetical protein
VGGSRQKPLGPESGLGGEGSKPGDGALVGSAGRPGATNLDGTGGRQSKAKSRRRTAWCHSHGMCRCARCVGSISRGGHVWM